MSTDADQPSVFSRARLALSPEPAPVLLQAGIAVVIDIIIVFLVVRAVLVAAGHGPDGAQALPSAATRRKSDHTVTPSQKRPDITTTIRKLALSSPTITVLRKMKDQM